MELFDVDLFKTDETQSAEPVDASVDKLKAFAEVEDSSEDLVEAKEDLQLDFDVDFDVLDKLNASENVKPVISKTPEKEYKEKSVQSVPVSDTNVQEQQAADNSTVKQAGQATNKFEKLDNVLDKLDEYGNKAIEKLGIWCKQAGKNLVLYVPTMLSNYQDKKIHKKFEKGDLVVADNFQFLMYQGELMVYKYTGTSTHILIPDYVGNLPVRYVYKGFLNKNLFDNHRVRTVLSYFKDDNISELSIDSLKDSMTGVKSIQLPKELVYVPRNLFSGTGDLDTVIIPESVRLVSPSAFSKSNIRKVYFNGSVPKNLKRLELISDFSIFCKEEYAQGFIDELAERRAS